MDKASLVKAALANTKKPSSKKPPVKPSAGVSDADKSADVKAAKKGKDFGKKNMAGKAGFQAVEQKADKEYGSAKAGKKVAGAVFWKSQKKG